LPTWGEILVELQATQAAQGTPDFDGVRRKYLRNLHQVTGRDTILYATNWLSGGGGPGTSITLEDMQGMMEVCRGLSGPALDIVLHSPGGSAEGTASIVRYLRSRFDHLRVFVPIAAMSAGTMWALGADVISMGKHSQLGPIDPQIFRPQEQRYVPARAIVEQFERAKRECAADPRLLGAWLPILQQYGTSLIEECEKAEALGKGLVQDWLANYMFKNRPDAHELAKKVADYFSDYSTHRSHALGIPRAQAAGQQLVIEELEADSRLQDAVLSAFHATMHTVAGPAVKIVENHLGRAFVKLAGQFAIPVHSPVQPSPLSMPASFTTAL
jgi:hypothetical protein